MSLYSLLEVDEDASTDEIKKSFRRLSMRYHPDRPDGDPNKYKEINNAYNILSDEDKRKEYNMKTKMESMEGVDLFSMLFGRGGMASSSHSSSPVHVQSHSNHDEDDEIPFIFESLFHGGPSMRGMSPNIRIFRNGKPVYSNMVEKPQPIHTTCKITLEEAFHGTSKNVEIKRWVMKNNIKLEEYETIYVDIPKGMDNNEIVILENKGHIQNDVLKGDIKVVIQVEEHKLFKRNGLDLTFIKSLSFKESLCGFQFILPYIDGRQYNINSEPGKIVHPGFKKSVPSMGLQRNDRRGNLIIQFEIKYPESLPLHVIEYLSKTLS